MRHPEKYRILKQGIKGKLDVRKNLVEERFPSWLTYKNGLEKFNGFQNGG